MKKAKIEVFKAGKYGDTEGRIWSMEEVQQLADNYDPSYRNAPIILGHNDWNGEKPAYGWAESFEVNENGILVANIEYNDDLEELVKKKMYTRVSIEATKKIELYDQYEGKQGAYVLAVALLGGSQPAVSGLQPVQFSADDAKFAESLENDIEAFIVNVDEQQEVGTESVENGNGYTAESSDTITGEVDENSTENKDKEKDVTPEELEKFKAEKDALAKEQARIKAEKEALMAEREEFLAQKRKESISAFIAENDKKIIPAVKEDTQAFMETLNDEQLEQYKKIITALPDAEIFESMTDEKNKDEHIDTDEKFQKQAEADLQAVKK